MDLDLRKIRYFVAVAEQLHFGRAAEHLHIAQPVLSRQIKALEDDLGTALLVRDRRHVELTDAGTRFLADARHLLATARLTWQRARAASVGEDRLSVGFLWGIAVTRAISAFGAEYPHVVVDVRQLAVTEASDAVLGGTVDVAFVRPPLTARALRVASLGAENRLVAVSRRHPLACGTMVRRADLVGERILGQAPEDGPIEQLLEMVAQGRGITVVPESAATFYTRPDITYVSVADLPPGQIWLAARATETSGPVAAFMRIAARTGVGPDGDQGIDGSGFEHDLAGGVALIG